MASGAASFMPASISSAMTRPHAATDSRLLQNLIKSEKTYQNHLTSVVQSSGTAAAALKAWGTSEARDVAQTSSQLADLLHDVSDAQNNYLQAIKGYREALKDVADREASIRTIVKDRDILVSRLIKASKKNGDVPHAQRELTACEEVLEEEERALVGVKRRTFKEALSMRMKLMGDAGNRMVECAKIAILLLDEFDQHAGDERMSIPHHEIASSYNQGYHEEGYEGHEEQGGIMSHPQTWAQDGIANEQYYQADHDASHFQSHEVASVTPSQSASQTARGGNTTYGSMAHNNGYERPQFADGVPREAEERADSDASSVADDREEEQQQIHYNRGGEDGRLSRNQNTPSAEAPSKAAPLPAQESLQNLPPQPTGGRADTHQPQMHLPTAPRFNYDGSQLAPIPQAPRLYHRDEENSSDGGDLRGTVPNSGWNSSRPAVRSNEDRDSDTEDIPHAQARGSSSRPNPQKRNSFFGKFKGLFKADLGDKQPKTSQSQHRRNESSDRTSSVAGWTTRTDTNISSGRKSASKANGTYKAPHQGLMKPLATRNGDDSDSEDDDNRPDLVRVVNPNVANRQVASDVGGTLRRTPSELSRITAGPLSTKQQREADLRKQAELERKAREAVIGGGIGAKATPLRSDTKLKKKKKKTTGARSIAGSEVGTSATRQGSNVNMTSRPVSTIGVSQSTRGGVGNYVVPGDLSSGSRGLASLVLPSDLGKPDRPYPSIMPPTGLSRSNSTATAATGRASTIGGGATKKKKRQSAVSDGVGTGLTAMSPRDGGKWTTHTWVQGPQTGAGNGLAAQAVSGAGLVPYKPASPEEIAQKYASNSLTGAQIQRPGSAQSGAPLRSAMKGHNELAQQSAPVQRHQTHSSAPPPQQKTIPPDVSASSPQGQVVEAQASPVPSISPPPPAVATGLTGNVGPEQTQESTRPTSSQDDNYPPTIQEESSAPREQPQQMASPKLSQDSAFDGTGRLGLSREVSPLPDSPDQHRKSDTPASRKPTIPRLDMPASEPFNFDVAGMQERQRQQQQNSAKRGEEADLLTPGEQLAYEQLLGSEAMNTPSQQAAPPAVGLGVGQSQQSEGITKTTALRHRIGLVTASSTEEEPSSSTTASFPDPISRPGANPIVGRPSMEEPSRTYSNNAGTIPTLRSVVRSASPAPDSAGTHLQPPSTVGAGSGVGAAASEVSGTTGVSRRKSVRLAPDTKLPPDTPVMEKAPGLMSDGFGGFTSSTSPHPLPVLHSVTAPGSALASSGNGATSTNTTAYDGPSLLSSRIAPPPQAPPRLPSKDAMDTPGRERSSWSTRIDRRLVNDDSSDEEAMGGGGAGEGEDAYASARRAMGVASKRWQDTVSPARKKKSKDGSKSSTKTGGGGSVKSKSGKRNASGYNSAIPLPKGMEVVGRQKASK